MASIEVVLKGGRLDGSVRYVHESVAELNYPDSEAVYLVTNRDGQKLRVQGTLCYKQSSETDGGRPVFKHVPTAPPKGGVLLSDNKTINLPKANRHRCQSSEP